MAYDGRSAALAEIDLGLESGRSYGIVGPPGAGKTTLVRLIGRLYEPTGGTLRVDGIALVDIRLADLRQQIAYVPQDPFLFAGTLGDNITLGEAVAPGRLEPILREAARTAPIFAEDPVVSSTQKAKAII